MDSSLEAEPSSVEAGGYAVGLAGFAQADVSRLRLGSSRIVHGPNSRDRLRLNGYLRPELLAANGDRA